MEGIIKQEFLLATTLATDATEDEVNDICDNFTDKLGHKDRQHKLSVVLPPTRSRSPVTVQEWVAALPDHAEEEEEKDDIGDDKEETEDHESVKNEADNEPETDTLHLGAEAGYIQPQNVAKLLLASRYGTKHTNSGSTSDKRGQFQHSDTAASLRSNLSALSTAR